MFYIVSQQQRFLFVLEITLSSTFATRVNPFCRRVSIKNVFIISIISIIIVVVLKLQAEKVKRALSENIFGDLNPFSS